MKVSAVAVGGVASLAQLGEARAEEQLEFIEPFSIEIPETVLDDLNDRLARTRFPDQLEDVGWSYGTDLAYLKELCAYWRSEFDWRAQERALNRFAHFRTEIDGLGIHFIHQRSKEKNATPLIITHGWPGSFMEFTKIIGPLTNPIAHGGRSEDAFHVICPSIPGYGFSDAPKKPGFGCRQIADVFAKLMPNMVCKEGIGVMLSRHGWLLLIARTSKASTLTQHWIIPLMKHLQTPLKNCRHKRKKPWKKWRQAMHLSRPQNHNLSATG
jgi:hypothetical protein